MGDIRREVAYTPDGMAQPIHCPCCENPPEEPCVVEHIVSGSQTLCGIPIANTFATMTDAEKAIGPNCNGPILDCEECDERMENL